MHLSAMDGPIENCEEIEANDIHLLESIGKGSFGVVYKAVWRELMVAVKKVETESEVNEFYNEVQQLAKVQHENIIHLYGACTSGLYKCLVIEFADGGSLYHLLHNSPNTQYNLAHGISWLFQCAKAVSYLHSIQPRPLLHRDLKPPNLLLTKGAKVLKVCDFGTACELSTIMSDNRGSAAWMAPEVFEGKLYTEKCDVYSWGIILWEVVTRRVPFEDLGLAVRIMWAVHQRQRPPLITGCPKLLETLMKRCWDHNQARRPRMEEVVEKMCLVTRFLKGADEPISNPPSDDSITDSYRSACIDGSSAGHTSRDVSELSCSTEDLLHPPPPSSSCCSTNSTHNHLHPHSFPNSHPHTQPNPTALPHPHPDPFSSPYHQPQLNPLPLHPLQHPHYHHHYHHQQQSHINNSNNNNINNNAGFPAVLNEDSQWLSSSSEGTFPPCDSPSRGPSPRLTPAISPNVSSTVVISAGRGSPWSSVGSLDPEDPCMQPLAITIPGPPPPTRSDVALVSPCPPTIALTPITGNVAGVSPSGVPLRRHLSPGDSVDPMRRRSAEVSPQTHSPCHVPLDPSIRDPGGSLGGVEGALKYRDMPSLLPPTPSPSPSTTTTTSTNNTTTTTTLAGTTTTTTTTTTTAFPSWLPYPLYGPEPGGGGSHNGEGVGGGGGGGGSTGGGRGGKGPDEEELGAFWELLDTEIRPVKPLPACPESQKIFNEHKEMAGQYLVLQQEIFNLRQRKTVLEEKLSQAEKLERIGNQRYQDKIQELESKKENLRHTHIRLRQQLEQIHTRQEEQRQRQQQEEEEDGIGEPTLDLSLTPP
ncbi:probable serine/threonine-protein kinase DDB_G0278665 isoform X2 [Portunus trituberculatus]|uniref:probable serine/threonine-protein kinase DDB_G0278665 isoform X2 n=1 Tax=Portunus trituberculatus TaxID=210409 RepID=UPI001E1CF2A3|nr:probable serine/threonine-protein kinase DDB_G0278665 isoform X2 [Portunus trituberculatus]